MRSRPLVLLRAASQESGAAELLAGPAPRGTCRLGIPPAVTAVKCLDLLAGGLAIAADSVCFGASFGQLGQQVELLSVARPELHRSRFLCSSRGRKECGKTTNGPSSSVPPPAEGEKVHSKRVQITPHYAPNLMTPSIRIP
jgi:hypothetical protein